MINSSKIYQDYNVFVQSKSLRGRSKTEYLRQVRKLAEYYPQSSLEQLTERQVFDYLIFRRDAQKLRPSTQPGAGRPAPVLQGVPPVRLAALAPIRDSAKGARGDAEK